MVQWNRVVAMAVCTASSDAGRSLPGGGLMRWLTGSTTPKNIRPMPMPALNIMAIQETVRNSGFSLSAPSGIRPYRLIASPIANTTKPLATSTNAQPP
jgi:hypothetical protein